MSMTTKTAEAPNEVITNNKNVGENLTLTPKIHPLVKQFLAERETLFELARALGSPLNILFLK